MSNGQLKPKLPIEIIKSETTKFLMGAGIYEGKRCLKFSELFIRLPDFPDWTFKKTILLFEDDALSFLKLMRDLDYDDAIERLAQPLPKGVRND